MISTPRIAAPILALFLLAGCSQPPASSTLPADQRQGARSYHCGLLPVTVHYRDGGLTLEAEGSRYELEPVSSASGARYRTTAEDGRTRFWNKGAEARLTLEGQPRPECVPPATPVEPFEASGNEPFWHLTLGNRQLKVERPDREPVTTRVALHQEAERRVTALPATGSLPRLHLEYRLCRDSMTGMPHPFHVRLETNGDALTGCGGRPARLLQGVPWQVQTLAGIGDVSAFPLTLTFATDGRVSGQADCNRYHGDYQLGGEGLSIGPLASTRKGCASERLEREQRFLRHLERVERFDLQPGGVLVLRAGGETLIRARPVPAQTALPPIPRRP